VVGCGAIQEIPYDPNCPGCTLVPAAKGRGRSDATKITVDKKAGSIVLENWGTSLVLLQGVRREKNSK
jgi:hypothetical protein